MPDLNPFNEPLRRAKTTLDDLNKRKDTIVARLKWFDGTSEQALSSNLRACHATIEGLRSKIAVTIDEIGSNQTMRDRTASGIKSPLNPRNWFAADQRQLRQTKNEIGRRITELQRAQKELEGSLSLAETKRNEASIALKTYNDFNAVEHRTSLQGLETQITSQLSRAKLLLARKKEVDRALEPVVAQMRQYSELSQQWTQRRDRAASLDGQLNNASNGYERALVHEECERQFQVGSPRKVIVECEKHLRRIKSDYDKAHRRAAEIGAKAARRIDSIVIDGNNLCYDNGTFIGSAALDALVPLLFQDYTVTIVFDAAIRRMLRMDDRALAAHFGGLARVHVVATGSKADETLLDIASAEQYAYVLSNDRFGEFNDKEVVRQRRLIRHEIFGQRILVHDLGVDTTFQPSQQ